MSNQQETSNLLFDMANKAVMFFKEKQLELLKKVCLVRFDVKEDEFKDFCREHITAVEFRECMVFYFNYKGTLEEPILGIQKENFSTTPINEAFKMFLDFWYWSCVEIE